MRKVPEIVVALTLVAHTAAAAPCEVTFVRAPDDVRTVIEAWVAAEPRCGGPLELRIVPTDGGYYLVARDAADRIRERYVPDAQTAGVLVASWVADDAGAPERALYEQPRPRGRAMPPIPPRVELLPREAAALEEAAALPVRGPGRSGQLALLFSLDGEGDGWGDDDAGVRGELDLRVVQGWNLGAAASVTYASYPVYRALDTGDLSALSVQVTGYVARDLSLGPLWLRGELGAGFVVTHVTGVLYNSDAPNFAAYYHPDEIGVMPTAEASLSMRLIGDRSFQIEAGPYVRWLGQSFALDMPASGRLPSRGMEALVSAAVRWGR